MHDLSRPVRALALGAALAAGLALLPTTPATASGDVSAPQATASADAAAAATSGTAQADDRTTEVPPTDVRQTAVQPPDPQPAEAPAAASSQPSAPASNTPAPNAPVTNALATSAPTSASSEPHPPAANAPAPSAPAPSAPAPSAPATETPTIAAPGTEAPAVTSPAPPASEAGVTVASSPPEPGIDGVKAEIERRLGDAAPKRDADREAIVSFYAGRAHQPLWVGPIGLTPRGEAVVAALVGADAYGLSARDYPVPTLDAAPGADRPSAPALAALDLSLTEAALKYARHARGGRMDPRELSLDIDRDLPLLATALVLAELAAADKPGAYLTALHPHHPQFARLRDAYVRLRSGDADAQAKARRVLLNMEQWRWMPQDLGDLYVWANIPEFTVTIVRNGSVVHSERMIAGKTDKKTPIFSDAMETIVFHPAWGVPDSIKVKEVLPSLLKGGKILASHNLRFAQGGRDVDPRKIDWTKSDIRRYHVYQPPGGGNVLGVVKFMFPNKHQVYMHDTPTKNLFNATQRTFSHGCLRVRDPLALARILLEADKGWPQSRVAALAKPGAGQNNSVPLTRKIPVHVTYFTASVDDAGNLAFKPDPYGHEKRIQMGLDGKAHLIPKEKIDLGSARADVIARLGEARQNTWYGTSGTGSTANTPDWARRAFGSSN